MNRTTEKIPTWSLCYLINGDATALTDDEIRMVDEWVSQWQVEIVSPLMDEDGSTHPLFQPLPPLRTAHRGGGLRDTLQERQPIKQQAT